MQNTFSQSGNDSKWFLRKIIFQNRYVALKTPSRPLPSFMANTILNFHFDYLNPSQTIITENKGFFFIRVHKTVNNRRELGFNKRIAGCLGVFINCYLGDFVFLLNLQFHIFPISLALQISHMLNYHLKVGKYRAKCLA